MLAQIVLTPAESKKLIAKAVARLKTVRKAADRGIVAIHPSSSTYFIVEELTGSKPKTNYWVCGVVSPRGMCVEMAMAVGAELTPHEERVDPGDLQGTWVREKCRQGREEKLSTLLYRMTSSDVYVKVEKLIPIPVKEAAREAKFTRYDSGMGMPVGLYPCPSGDTIDEVRAIEILSGATAIPIASGGLGGAEGAVTFILKGDSQKVKKALDFVEQSKGARLPNLRLCNCNDCPVPNCEFPMIDKKWNLS
ncbi:MAG: hypothetical protein P8Y80_06090 [Acidobacteriota bacterium]